MSHYYTGIVDKSILDNNSKNSPCKFSMLLHRLKMCKKQYTTFGTITPKYDGCYTQMNMSYRYRKKITYADYAKHCVTLNKLASAFRWIFRAPNNIL